MTAILPINFQRPSPIRHRPANVPAHGVEEVLLGLGLDHTDPLTGLLEPLEFNLSGNTSHSALVFTTLRLRLICLFPQVVLFLVFSQRLG